MNKNQLFIYLLWGFFVLFSLSCSRHSYKSLSNELVIYPPPPDTARIQYLTNISGSYDITGKRSAFGRFLFGEIEGLGIEKPYGIATHKSKIFICDTKLKGLEIIDLDKHSFEYFIPAGKGQLLKPINCNVDNNGSLFVADIGRRQVVVFDSIGKYVNSFGQPDNTKPTDVFVKANKIWVVDFLNHRVDVYDKNNYELLFSFPDSEPGNEDFLYSPTNIYVTDNKVYVSDFGDFKIKIYTHEGEFIQSVGSYGRRIGQFVRPKGIAVDRDSNLYVVDAGFENAQIFNKDGELLMFFGGSDKEFGGLWLPAKIAIDYNNLEYFENYVDESFHLKYLIYITNQFGPNKINVYGCVEPKKYFKK